MNHIEIRENLIRQINSNWKNDFVSTWGDFDSYIEKAVNAVVVALEESQNKYYERFGFSNYNSVHYGIFLYYLSHAIGSVADENQEIIKLADQIYYLNKIMNSVDWYWGIKLPKYFMCEHPIGTVLGRAEYGKHFCVYQGCTVGGNRRNGKLSYPKLGDNVLMYSNSSIIGECNIGDNVILATNTKIVNQDVPSNTLVFGSEKNLVMKNLTEKQKLEWFGAIWKL